MSGPLVCENGFRRRACAGEVLVGTIVSLNSPQAAEILSDTGFDWLFIDAEHGTHDPLAVESLIQATGDRTPCLVRIPVHEETWIEKMLDVGASGIIAPQVNTVAQAEQVVNYAKYPPQGERGVGIARAHRYGAEFETYLAQANDSLLTVIQIEHKDAVENVRELAVVEGVDVLFIGPYDLSTSMGIPGQVHDPAVQEAIAKVLEVCQEVGKIPGIFGIAPDVVSQYIDMGFTLVGIGVDTLFLSQAASEALKGVRS